MKKCLIQNSFMESTAQTLISEIKKISSVTRLRGGGSRLGQSDPMTNFVTCLPPPCFLHGNSDCRPVMMCAPLPQCLSLFPFFCSAGPIVMFDCSQHTAQKLPTSPTSSTRLSPGRRQSASASTNTAICGCSTQQTVSSVSSIRPSPNVTQNSSRSNLFSKPVPPRSVAPYSQEIQDSISPSHVTKDVPAQYATYTVVPDPSAAKPQEIYRPPLGSSSVASFRSPELSVLQSAGKNPRTQVGSAVNLATNLLNQNAELYQQPRGPFQFHSLHECSISSSSLNVSASPSPSKGLPENVRTLSANPIDDSSQLSTPRRSRCLPQCKGLTTDSSKSSRHRRRSVQSSTRSRRSPGSPQFDNLLSSSLSPSGNFAQNLSPLQIVCGATSKEDKTKILMDVTDNISRLEKQDIHYLTQVKKIQNQRQIAVFNAIRRAGIKIGSNIY